MDSLHLFLGKNLAILLGRLLFVHSFIHSFIKCLQCASHCDLQGEHKDAQELEWEFLTLAPQIPKNE